MPHTLPDPLWPSQQRFLPSHRDWEHRKSGNDGLLVAWIRSRTTLLNRRVNSRASLCARATSIFMMMWKMSEKMRVTRRSGSSATSMSVKVYWEPLGCTPSSLAGSGGPWTGSVNRPARAPSPPSSTPSMLLLARASALASMDERILFELPSFVRAAVRRSSTSKSDSGGGSWVRSRRGGLV